MERLHVNRICDIVHRLRRGQSERAIAMDLGHSRHTVRHYHQLARQHGYLDPQRPLPEPQAVLAALGRAPSPPEMTSSVEPYRPVVEALVNSKVEMMTIHNRLVREHGYQGSYSSVRRFVRRLKPGPSPAYARIETAPGREAQVDFGGVGRIPDRATGKLRQAYCFVMTLSFSRHQYAELVFDQKMETWIGCHERAFAFFKGVPEAIVIDNLKAAVLRVDLNDPTLSAPYSRLAQHYGFLVHPCRVRTPEHKGKVENGIRYIQRSFMAGRQFLDIEDANQRLRDWVLNEAGIRNHGTTHEAPLKRFTEMESSALMALPAETMLLLRVTPCTVARDGYVTLDGAYYQVPYTLVGRKLVLHVYQQCLQIFDGVELLVTYDRATQKGLRMSRDQFLSPGKREYLLRPREQCPQAASLIGPKCRELVDSLLTERPVDKLRSVHGVIRLGDKFGNARLEAACARAIHYGDPSYVRVKKTLEAGLDQMPIELHQIQVPTPAYEFARSADELLGDLTSPPTWDVCDTDMEVDPC